MTIKEVSRIYGITEDTLRYYEKIGMIPPVHRTQGGIRDYIEEDIKWLELALCMRSAGLPVDVMIQYLKLYKEGNTTIVARLELLKNQRDVLIEQQKRIEETINRLNYKIARYEVAVETGQLVWDKDCSNIKNKERKNNE